MKAPCKYKCKADITCICAGECSAWREFVKQMRKERESNVASK